MTVVSTTSAGTSGASADVPVDLRHAHRRRDRGQRAQGHPGHPGRRAGGHPDPAVLRPPAARPGRRLPAVHRRGRGAAQAAGLVHRDGHRGHGGAHPAHLAGRRQGAARHDGAAADQPPARLPGLRQGRRVPAAEPGDEQRQRRDALHRPQAHLPQAAARSPRRCCSTASAACSAPAAPGSPSRSPATRSSSCSSAARWSRSRCTRTSRSRATSPATPCRSARSARSPAPPTGSGPGPSTWSRTATVCEHCASGCAQRTDHRRGKVQRRLAGDDPQVNEEWNCDKGRWAFTYATAPDRLTTPLVRGADGVLREASWTEALEAAADGLAAAGGVGVLTGGRLTLEDAYAYAKFARTVLGTHDVDVARPAALRRGGWRSWRTPWPAPAATSPAPSPTPTWRPRPGCCSSASSPRRSRRSSSSGCARPPGTKGLARLHRRPAALPGGPQGVGDAAADRPGRGDRAAGARWPAGAG